MSDMATSLSAPGISASLSAPPPARSEDNRFALPLALAIFLTAWACTGAHFQADTSVYTSAILTHQHRLPADDYHRLTSNPFWEFGHLLWRPIGWVSFAIGGPLIRVFHSSERVKVMWSLMTLDFVASVICVTCFFLLARRVINSTWVALLSALLLGFSDAFLNYSHSGNAYPVGLACLLAGIYSSISASAPVISKFKAGIAGLMFALAVLFWFPYIFVLPAAFVTPLLLQGHDRHRLQLAGVSIGVCALVGFAAYSAAIAQLGISNLGDLRAWILAAGHGQSQPGGLRAVARLAFSLPRSFINMGNDGMLLKRYLVNDPYSPERLADLVRLSLWKIALFYASLIVVCVALCRSKTGHALLLVLATSAIPIVLFSLFLFEAGSIERYLPLYPFVFLAWGYALASPERGILVKTLLITLFVSIMIVNINAMRRGTLQKAEDQGRERIIGLVPKLTPASLVLAVNEQDSLAEFCHEFPLDPINSEHQWRYYDVLEVNAARLSTWRRDLATRMLWSWHDGGTVWIPLRVLRDRPEPEWNWVEGDDPRVRWTDLPAFFTRFNRAPPVGGPDGFVSLPDDPNNEQIATAFTKR